MLAAVVCSVDPSCWHRVVLLQAWLSLPGSVRSGGNPTREEALQAVAVVNRIRRLLSETSGKKDTVDKLHFAVVLLLGSCCPWPPCYALRAGMFFTLGMGYGCCWLHIV